MHEARRTRATVLFADLVGFTMLSERLGPERAYLIATGCLRQLDAIARKHGGSVDKYLGDCLMAVFGHPLPIERAARAACRAALEMREQVRHDNRELALECPLDLVIGVNTGWMVAGDISGPTTREFHVLGDAVNVAARLKSRAPLGSIYIGPETQAEIGGFADTRALEPLALKGRSRALPAFELLAPRSGAVDGGLGAQPIVWSKLLGRENELERLRVLLRELGTGRGAVVTLVGAAGMGKSRLLAELGACEEMGQIGLLQVRGDVGPELLDPDALRRRAGSAPIAVVVDDLDDASADSLRALESALGVVTSAPICFLLAHRQELRQRAPALFAALRRPEIRHFEVLLEALDREQSRLLVESVIGAGVIPEETWNLIHERARGVPGHVIAAGFLSPALRKESGEATRPDDAERRRATILFADITGFTAMTERLGAERAYPIVAGCLRLLDDVARKHGGTVDKYLGDCVMALFGIPQAIEDAPRAALNAAIEMRRRVREDHRTEGLDVHIGINTGLGIAGDISGPLVREFAVMGDPVSIADRLKDVAPPGAIYVGSEAYRFTRDTFEFHPMEAIQLTGRATEIPVYELLSQEERLYRSRIGAGRQVFSPLVGREQELERLREAVLQLGRGDGAVLAVIAEAGLGKSRLISEVAAGVEAQDVVWLEGRSLSTGQHLSFHPFADLARSWAGITDDDDEASARAKVETGIAQLMGERAEEVFPFIATVMGIRLEGAPRERIERIQGDALQRLIHRSVLELMTRQSQLRPVAIVLEDLHWADQTSIELLEAMLSLVDERPMLFVLAARPGFASTSGHVLTRARERHSGRFAEIRLRPLDGRACRSLLNNLFRQGDLPYETRRLIESKAGGNPFYIEEVVRSLVDQGAVEHGDGSFRATDRIRTVEIPGTVQEVIMSRVDRLDLAKRRLLQVASVIGGTFHELVLTGVVGEKGIADLLGELIDAEFLVPSDRTHGVEYAFKHPLIQEVTYDGLLEARREELHRAVASAIETRLPEGVPGFFSMVAYHFSKGRDAARAETYLFRAGDEAARAAGSSEALNFFREASRLYLDQHRDGGDPAKKARLQRSIARALYFRGQLVEAVESYNRAIEFLGERVPRKQPAMGVRFARNLVGALLRVHLPNAERRPPATERDREVIDLMFQRGLCEVTADATRFLFDSIALLSKLTCFDPSSVSGSGGLYAGSAVIFSYGGVSFAIGRRILDLAKRVVREDDIEDLVPYRMMRFTHHFLEGDWSDEHEMPEPLLQRGLQHGRTWDVLSYLQGQTEKRICMGDFSTARHWMSLNDRIWDDYQNDLARSQHGYFATALCLEQRRLEDAVRAADEYYEENPEESLHIHALSFKARALALLGDLEQAELALAVCAEIIASQGQLAVPKYMMSQYLRSRLLVDVTRLAEAPARSGVGARARWRRRAFRTARRAARAAAWVAERRPEVYRLTGELHWHGGSRHRALEWWRRSLAAAGTLGARPESARTFLDLARYLEGVGGEVEICGERLDAARCLERAGAAFAELDLKWDLERLSRAHLG